MKLHIKTVRSKNERQTEMVITLVTYGNSKEAWSQNIQTYLVNIIYDKRQDRPNLNVIKDRKHTGDTPEQRPNSDKAQKQKLNTLNREETGQRGSGETQQVGDKRTIRQETKQGMKPTGFNCTKQETPKIQQQ